jgi:hypothetical protein
MNFFTNCLLTWQFGHADHASLSAREDSDLVSLVMRVAINSPESIKSLLTVPVSPSSEVECHRCRQLSKNYSDSLLFHGSDIERSNIRGFDGRSARQFHPGG